MHFCAAPFRLSERNRINSNSRALEKSRLIYQAQSYYDYVTTPLHRCYNPVTLHSVTSFSHFCNIFVTVCQYLCSAIRDRTIPLVALIMTKEKVERITTIYNWVRFTIIVVFLTFVFAGLANAQTSAELMIRF